jgi:hypothetical protein
MSSVCRFANSVPKLVAWIEAVIIVNLAGNRSFFQRIRTVFPI